LADISAGYKDSNTVPFLNSQYGTQDKHY